MTIQQRAQVDKLLTNVSNMVQPEGYISEMILPMVAVKQTTGLVGKYGNGHLRIVNTFTGGKGKYAQVDSITRSSDTYTIEHHGLKSILTPEDYENVELPFDAEEDETIALSTHLFLGKEKALADALSSTSIITQNAVPATKYNDYSSTGTLLANIRTAKTTVKGSVGVVPDTAIMSWEVAEALRYHPAMLDSLGFKESRPGGLQDQELARALNVRRVLIGGATYNSAKQGQSDSLAPVWGDVLIFAVCPLAAQKRQISLGYRFQYAKRKPRQVYKSPVDEPVDSVKLKVVDDYDQLLTTVNAAFLLNDVLS
jgi:hypothetical protein